MVRSDLIVLGFRDTLYESRDAWDSVKDVSKEEAQTKYVDTFIEVRR